MNSKHRSLADAPLMGLSIVFPDGVLAPDQQSRQVHSPPIQTPRTKAEEETRVAEFLEGVRRLELQSGMVLRHLDGGDVKPLPPPSIIPSGLGLDESYVGWVDLDIVVVKGS